MSKSNAAFRNNVPPALCCIQFQKPMFGSATSIRAEASILLVASPTWRVVNTSSPICSVTYTHASSASHFTGRT